MMNRIKRCCIALLVLAVTAGTIVAETPKKADADKALNAAHAKYKSLNEGKNADYIPALAKVPSNYYGIVLVTPDGQISQIGDVDKQFSIQSICKVFTMALVLKESGENALLEGVGVDATGRAFNSIEAIEQSKGKEINPLVNPGAIAVMSQVTGANADDVWNKVIAFYSDFAGRTLEVNQEVYKSESDTNQRNRAIGELMGSYSLMKTTPAVAVDLYTKACSVNVTAKDLAIMAATLANGGKNPVTKKQVIDPKYVPEILAVMATAGLYDDSGKWLFATGLPAKSGVGGGIIAVSPGKFGIAVFSPPLDKAGNSVRAQKAITDVSDSLNGNPYKVTPK
jgi:glutaminase